MATYVDITKQEFDSFMDDNFFVCINPDQSTKEFVYVLMWHDGEYTMKVYSSITERGTSRGKGKDAIRVVLLVNDGGKNKPVWKGKRVHRVEGWRENLQERIDMGLAIGCEGEDWQCENCGGHMLLREGKRGFFYGCENFPDHKNGCRFTRDYEG